jgi:predicted ATPase
VGDVARTAAAILAQCPGVTLLATSREPLGVPGERTYRLPSLELAAAVELFADRAAAANPAFAVDALTRANVERICERLDGIALAIELAAARLRAISVEELSQRLTDRFRVLTGGSRTALPRQQTMRALIDWSYDTLGDDEKAVFRRLSVFTGGWSLEAAAAVAGDDALDEWAVLDCVSQLVDKSLVVATVTGATQRYSFLQSIAEYAAEQLGAAGERAAREERHARYYAGVAQRAYREWDVGARPGWLAELTPERDNLRAALGWSLEERGDTALGARLAADIAPAMMRFAPPSEAIRWSLAALPEARDAPELEARLQYALSMLYNNQASYTSALAAAERAADLSAQIDDDRASVRTFSQLAQQYARQGRHTDALTCAQRSLDAARRLGDLPLLAATLQRCANVFKPREIDRARAQFKESVALFRSLERTEDTARALTFWAAAEAHAGSFEQAIALSEEALALGAHETQLYLTNNVACCAVAAGRDDLALTAARQTLQLAGASGHAAIAANAIVYLATLSAAADPARSAKLLAYAAGRASLGYERDELDDLIERRASAALAERLPETELQPLQAAGAVWTEDDALRAASAI